MPRKKKNTEEDQVIDDQANDNDEQKPEPLTWAQIRPDYQFSVTQEQADQIGEWVRVRLNEMFALDAESSDRLVIHYQLTSRTLMSWGRNHGPYKRGYPDAEMIAARFSIATDQGDGVLKMGDEITAMLSLDSGEIYQA